MKNFCLLSFLFLVGCSGTPIVNTVIQHDIPVNVPDAQPMVMNPMEWKILTLDQLEAIVKSNNHVLYFSLDTKNYTNLQLNMIEIQRYIKEQMAIIDMLKKINADRANEQDTKPK
jgi:hypothetical protein